MSELDEYLEFAKDLADKAGKIMNHYYGLEEKGIETKDDQTPVTLADKEINSLVISKVKKQFPLHGVLGEEESFNLGSENLWVVDPLDGTMNFAKSIPLFAFSIALVEKSELRVGLVYNPIAGRILYASAGNGAYENGQKLQLSNVLPERIKLDAWLAGGIKNSIWADPQLTAEARRLIDSDNKVVDQKDWPVAYALALVGSGDFDATLSTIKTPWDVAAGCLIAKEAGAKVTDLYGEEVSDWTKEANGILVAVPRIHSYLLKLLAPILGDKK